MFKNISYKILAALFVLSGAYLISCKKTDSIVSSNTSISNNSNSKKGVIYFSKPTARLVDSADISIHGFLIFPDVNVLESYRQYLLSHTHGQVQTYLTSQGFSSYGASIYKNNYLSQMVTNEQAADYLLDTNLLVQIGKIIYRTKPSDRCTTVKWSFILTLSETDLNPSTLADMNLEHTIAPI